MPTMRQKTGELNASAVAGGAEERLEASVAGLSQAEVKDRLAQYGFNELPEKKVNLVLKFLSYFWGPIAWMIEAAVILSTLGRNSRLLTGLWQLRSRVWIWNVCSINCPAVSGKLSSCTTLRTTLTPRLQNSQAGR